MFLMQNPTVSVSINSTTITFIVGFLSLLVALYLFKRFYSWASKKIATKRLIKKEQLKVEQIQKREFQKEKERRRRIEEARWKYYKQVEGLLMGYKLSANNNLIAVYVKFDDHVRIIMVDGELEDKRAIAWGIESFSKVRFPLTEKLSANGTKKDNIPVKRLRFS